MGTTVYLLFIFPLIPLDLTETFDIFSGSYTSNDTGKDIFGSSNKLKLPFPETIKLNWNASSNNNSFLSDLISKLKFPTAPEKSNGLLLSGNGLTSIVELPEETVLFTLDDIRFPKKSLLFEGTWTEISKVNGSIFNLPVFWGYNNVLRNTTYL